MSDTAAHFHAALEAFGRLGIQVRCERLGGEGGGLCTLSGRHVLFVDLDADLATRFERSMAALAGLPETDDMYLLPALRAEIERLRADAE